MNSTPPKWAQRLLSRFHPEDTLEEVEGDLEELYDYWLQNSGEFWADVRYCFSVFTVLPPFVRRRKKREYHQPSNFGTDMLRNYFLVAWRNLARQKGYSLVRDFFEQLLHPTVVHGSEVLKHKHQLPERLGLPWQMNFRR